MHEMSLAEGILRILEENSRSQEYARVKGVWLEIGRLSHVEPEALRFCFDAVTRDTLAEGAQLEMIMIDGSGWCHDCSATVAIDSHYAACPRCGGYRVEATGGTEMRVKELEVE
jgi:hydrogenase nickel incorporation protein HypA/HybF